MIRCVFTGDEIVWFPSEAAMDALDKTTMRRGVMKAQGGDDGTIMVQFLDNSQTEAVLDHLCLHADEIEEQ